jgi:hypothetical protein
MKTVMTGLALGGLLLSLTPACHALQFANASQIGSTNTFKWAATGPENGGVLTVSGKKNWTFQYQPDATAFGLTGLTTGVQYVADLTFTAKASLPAQQLGFLNMQDFDSVTWEFKLDDTTHLTAAQQAAFNGKTLLKVAYSGFPGGTMAGNDTSVLSSPTFTAQQPITPVNYASFFLTTISTSIDQNYSYSLSNASSFKFKVDAADPFGGGIVKNFTASGTGTFSADLAVPEPGTVGLSVGLAVSGMLVGLRRRNAVTSAK